MKIKKSFYPNNKISVKKNIYKKIFRKTILHDLMFQK